MSTDNTMDITKTFNHFTKMTREDPQYAKILLLLEQNIQRLAVPQLCILLDHTKDPQQRTIILAKLHEKPTDLTTRQALKLCETDPSFLKPILHRCADLPDKEWTQLGEYLSSSALPLQTKISALDYLTQKKDRLSQFGLIWMSSLTSYAAPQQYQDLMKVILQNEITLAKQRESNVVLSVPRGVRCTPSIPVTLKGEEAPLNYLVKQKRTVFVDLQGELLTRFEPSGPPAFLTFLALSALPKDRCVSLAVQAWENGTWTAPVALNLQLSASKPAVHVPLPLALPSTVTGVRIVGTVEKQDLSGPVQKQQGSMKSELVVCYGDIHRMNARVTDTMGDLTRKATNRWTLPYVGYELQDVEYRVYPENTTFADYMDQGGSSVLRLAKLSDSRYF